MHVPFHSFAGTLPEAAAAGPLRTSQYDAKGARKLAIMGGAYGNVPALSAALAQARTIGCDACVFLGDATGCCGHSDETLQIIREHFPFLVAGNHEQQAAAGSTACGCNYASAEDEYYGGLAHQYAMRSLSEENRQWLGTWPDRALLQTNAGPILLCHGSPRQTNEFLYESELQLAQLQGWIAEFGVVGFACTHSGFPWIRQLGAHFAVNCGVVGKPDHDHDAAIHFATVEIGADKVGEIKIERVEYDHLTWRINWTAKAWTISLPSRCVMASGPAGS